MQKRVSDVTKLTTLRVVVRIDSKSVTLIGEWNSRFLINDNESFFGWRNSFIITGYDVWIAVWASTSRASGGRRRRKRSRWRRRRLRDFARPAIIRNAFQRRGAIERTTERATMWGGLDGDPLRCRFIVFCRQIIRMDWKRSGNRTCCAMKEDFFWRFKSIQKFNRRRSFTISALRQSRRARLSRRRSAGQHVAANLGSVHRSRHHSDAPAALN